MGKSWKNLPDIPVDEPDFAWRTIGADHDKGARTRREQGEDENRLELSGTLCKEPSLRITPLGRTICDMILAVNRRYGRADYLPCITWGSLARRCGAMGVGDRLHLSGRLQSRGYTKVVEGRQEARTAFEVSVMSLECGVPWEGAGAACSAPAGLVQAK